MLNNMCDNNEYQLVRRTCIIPSHVKLGKELCTHEEGEELTILFYFILSEMKVTPFSGCGRETYASSAMTGIFGILESSATQ
jgi:hypothetical protein